MSRPISFAVSCADTKLGFHVRVVGSSAELGCWDPTQGLQLSTGPSDFPTWGSPNLVKVKTTDMIEYKYVICDRDGKAVRWEERANRTVHLSALVHRGLLPTAGSVAVHESFNSLAEADEQRFGSYSCSSDASAQKDGKSRSKPQLIVDVEGNSRFDDEHASILFTPTVRERRNASMSVLAILGEESLEEEEAELPEIHTFTRFESTKSTHSEITLAREESCSNLFMPDDTHVEASEFQEKYALVGHAPLGEGTFGMVWLCTPKESSREVPKRAAKIVRKARLQSRDMRYLLGEDGEVKTHLTMKHPHITELFEAFDEAQTVTLVLEYCQGGDLFDAIVTKSQVDGRAFSEDEAFVVTAHVVSALAYIHRKRVVHRDIKCENVLLERAGVPVEQNVFKICDFGFAAHDAGDGLVDRLGSPDTVAPEVVVGCRYSFPVDVWSTGVLLYMMLSATPPFYAPTDAEVLRKVRTGSYSLSGDFWDSVDVVAKQAIAEMMTVDPKHRPTAAQVLAAPWLQAALPTVSGPSGTSNGELHS